ncbi:type IV pilus assembly protein PilM [Cryptosporangium japonicum]|uniref:type IV pilus assembly protein PilM n=1 Tax=Cryptosporangium japonicum TaxID=80872 RepID=UPI0031D9474F
MGTTSVIGLDIGSTSVRAVETDQARGGAVVTAVGEVALPPGAVQAGVIQDEAAVTAAVRRLRASAPLRSKTAVLGLTSAQTVVREMTVANLPRKEMRTSLPFQVGDMLPLPVDRAVLDFLPLETSDRDTVRGLLVAAPKASTLSAVTAVEAAGLTVARVDLASLALMRALAQLDGEAEAIVDIGAQLTQVIVQIDGQPLIVRTIPRGGAEVTAAVANRLRVETGEAEELKCRIGLNREENAEVADAVNEAIRPLMNEIRGSFAYLTAGGRAAEVARLVLSGGASLLQGLRWSLADQLDVPVHSADLFRRLRGFRGDDVGDTAPSPACAIAVGLTLGGTR